MRAVELLISVSVSNFFARMDDGSFRWVSDSMQLLPGGPESAWVERGLKARSVTWGGPSIKRPIGHDALLGTLNGLIANAQA